MPSKRKEKPIQQPNQLRLLPPPEGNLPSSAPTSTGRSRRESIILQSSTVDTTLQPTPTTEVSITPVAPTEVVPTQGRRNRKTNTTETDDTAQADLEDREPTAEELQALEREQFDNPVDRLTLRDLNDLPLTNPLGALLRDMAGYPLLTAEEEIRLAKQIKIAQEEKNKPKIQRNFLIIIKGELAEEKMVKSNLRLVASIAKRYKGRGLELLELINEGALGLMTKAVKKFDPAKGYKFSTYAGWWIRQAISRAIADQSRTIRLPVHQFEALNKIKGVRIKLMQEEGYEPSLEQIAAKANMDLARVEELLDADRPMLSLEAPVNDEESTLGDLIAEKQEDIDRATLLSATADEIRKILQQDKTIKYREIEIVLLRFGFYGDSPTLEEVGKIYKITGERVRQLEHKVIEKIQSNEKLLKIFRLRRSNISSYQDAD